MALSLSIDPSTFVIHVDRASLTLIQSSPTEIREMDLNEFRLKLKDWEDDQGITFLKTHDHNTVVDVGGITLARVIQILEPYTITFEDGQYAVNLQGANSNVGDRVNVNQVSVRSFNSAGLVTSAGIEAIEYNGMVTIDVINGEPGTVYPTGTLRKPSNNLADALLIANAKGFKKLYFLESTSLSDLTISNFTIMGRSSVDTHILIYSSLVCEGLTIQHCNVTGILDGGSYLIDCNVGNITYVNGNIQDSNLYGTIQLAGGADAAFINCASLNQASSPYIDMGVSGQNLSVTQFSGEMTIGNWNDPTGEIGLGLAAGAITLDPSMEAGSIVISGVGQLFNNSTGTTTVNSDGLLNKELVAVAVNEEIGTEIQYSAFGGVVTIDVDAGVSGTAYPIGTPTLPVNNLTDAKLIAAARGFDRFHINSNLTLVTGDICDEYTFESENWLEIHIEPGVSLVNTNFVRVSLYGTMGGFWNVLTDCWVYDITNFCGWMRGGSFVHIELAEYTVESAGQSFFDSTLPMYPSEPAVLVMNTDVAVSFTNAVDTYQIESMTTGSLLSMGMTEGLLIIDNSCTGGQIIASGIGNVTNNSGLIIDDSSLMNKTLIATAVDEEIGTEIQYASFEGAVHISATGSAGTTYPIGTHQFPVNNVEDALTIAAIRGFSEFHFETNWTFSSDTYLTGITLRGEGPSTTTFTFEAGCVVAYCKCVDATLTGSETGIVGFTNCRLYDLGSVGLAPSSINIIVDRCLLKGTMTLPSNYSGTVLILDSWSEPTDAMHPPTLDHGNSTASIQFRNHSGIVYIKNMTENVDFRTFLASGGIVLESSVTAGTMVFSGVGTLTNNATSVTSLNTDGLMNKETLTKMVWNTVYLEEGAGTPGTAFPIGTPSVPANSIQDALDIAAANLINEIAFVGSITLPSGLTNFKLKGSASPVSCVVDVNNQLLNTVIFENCTVTGQLNAVSIPGTGWQNSEALVGFHDCYLVEVQNLEGTAWGCQIEGATSIRPTGWLSSVGTIIEGDFTVFDLGSDETFVSMDVESGWCQFINAVDGSLIELNVKGGEVSLDASCTGGEYYLEGIGTLFNDSAMTQKENHFLWDDDKTYHDVPGSMGKYIKNQLALNDVILGK